MTYLAAVNCPWSDAQLEPRVFDTPNEAWRHLGEFIAQFIGRMGVTEDIHRVAYYNYPDRMELVGHELRIDVSPFTPATPGFGTWWGEYS